MEERKQAEQLAKPRAYLLIRSWTTRGTPIVP
jgi:hypothetical protein